MNYAKMTKAQLIEMIGQLQDELVHVQAKESQLPWEDVQDQPVHVHVQAKTTTHAEIMRVRLAAAKAQAMATGRAVKA